MATEGSITTTTTAAVAPTATSTTTNRTNVRTVAPIYLSYSNQTGFAERYFVMKLYQQLVANGFGDGIIWFDHVHGIHPDKSATWLADRLEMIDLSMASLLILSDACQHQRLMSIESKAIVDRKLLAGNSSHYGLFVIFLDDCPDFSYIRPKADFIYAFSRTDTVLTVEERLSLVLKPLLIKLLPYKEISLMRNPCENVEEKTDGDKFKPICSWSSKDIQSFLVRLGVQEVCRELFSQRQIDGYLLLACTENELKDSFGMNNRKIRQMLIEHVIQIIHRERQHANQWHYEAKKIKGKNDCVYVIYDPEDHSIANQISLYLQEKKIRVFTHNPYYGKSKHEFLSINGPVLARVKDVIYLLTEKSSRSTFTFHELTLAEWFEKPIVTVYVENVWANMRSSIRALLADYPSVDFIHQSLTQSLAILHTYLRPQTLGNNGTPDYMQKLRDVVRPLASIAASNRNSKQKINNLSAEETNPDFARFVYLSYSKVNEKWNVIHAIERLIFFLHSHHFHTGIQINYPTNTSRENDPHFLPRINSKIHSANVVDTHAKCQSPTGATASIDIRHGLGVADIRHCRLMIVCLTPKYFQNEQSLNELRLCEIYQKPVVICLLRHLNQYRSQQTLNTSLNLDEQINTFIPARCPLTTLNFLRKNIRISCIDLSTNELFSRNSPMLVRRLEKILEKSSSTSDAPTAQPATTATTTTHPFDPSAFNQISEVF